MKTIAMVSFITFITEWKSLSLSFQGFIAALTISLSSLQAKGNTTTSLATVLQYIVVFGSQVTLHKVCPMYTCTHRRTIKCPSLSVCEAKSVDLVRYPTTLAPETGSKLVKTQCADNSHTINFNILVECLQNGVWRDMIDNVVLTPITPQCQCDEGYHKASVDGRMICQGENATRFLQYIIHVQHCSNCILELDVYYTSSGIWPFVLNNIFIHAQQIYVKKF